MKALLDKKVFTYNDVNSLPDGNYEIIDEEMVSMTPAGFRHGNLEGVFYALLTKHLLKNQWGCLKFRLTWWSK